MISSLTDLGKWDFLAMQYKAREQHYSIAYPQSQRLIVTYDGESAGGLWVDWSERTLNILDLAFMPQFQNQGLGTQILDQLIQEADRRDFVVEIATHTDNIGAQRLYERVGFLVLQTEGTHVFFRREPSRKQRRR